MLPKKPIVSTWALIALFFSAMIAFNACDQSTQTSDDDGNATNDNVIEHASSITSNETWQKSKIHIIANYVSIQNATVTIEPGTVIQFKSGAELYVGTGGGLIADGTTAAITFTGVNKQAGYWNYIEFSDKAINANSLLKNCIIEYAGGYSSNSAALTIANGATVENVTVTHSASNGVELDDSFTGTFSNNTITQCAGFPVTATFKSAPFIGKGQYTGNGKSVIYLDSDNLESDGTLLKQDVPYRMSGYNEIQNATLTIEAGTEIQMDSGAELDVETQGGIIADGSSAPITFTGVVKQKGYWNYFEIEEDAINANCVLKNVIFEYGGGYSQTGAMLYLHNSPTMENCTVRNSASYGVKIYESAYPSMNNNIFTQNGKAPIKTYFSVVGSLGPGHYSGNGMDYIEVNGAKLSRDITLLKLDVPYRLLGYNYIENATLTIEPGTTMEFDAGAEMEISTGAAIYAVGTDAEPITFTGAVKQKGYWNYFEVTDDADITASQISKCVFEYGGGYSSSGAMIYLNKTGITLNHSTVSHSQSWGIIYNSGSTPDLTDNTYFDNTNGDVHVR